MPSSHWLFPVVTTHPASLIALLRRHGFDATRGTSQITVVPAPRHRPGAQPSSAQRLMGGMVFLPLYPELQPAERRRLHRLLQDEAGQGS
jgi:hypothetical protein